ncbi:MAG TPA: hypothetical protein VFK70_02995 [Vicinamibacteria bacterium]|nr:hypothetical protein [Vicinamibacteria bacterium]
MGGLLFFLALGFLLISAVMVIIEAFGESLLWGLGCLLLPGPVTLLFIATHWSQTKKAFALFVVGVVLLALSTTGAGH